MKLVFCGAGNMAQAIFKGIIGSKILNHNDIYLTNKSNGNTLRLFAKELGVEYSYDDAFLLKDADYVFLGTKPHDFETVASHIKSHIQSDHHFISIMADLPINYIREKLETNSPVAKIMPNTNAQVGYLVTGISFSGNFDPHSKNEVTELTSTFGSVIKVGEEYLHQVTAITGSGSIFLRHVFEQYIKAGVSLGLEKKQVEESIKNLIVGASKMIEWSDLSMEQLRKNITFRGGAIQAGLNELGRHDIESISKACLDATVHRGITLSKSEDE